MDGFKIAKLDELIEAIGEDKVKAILASYSCPVNTDIEDFLHNKAILFSNQGLAKTHLVFASYKKEAVLVGYFTLASKTFFIKRSPAIGSRLRSRLQKFARQINEVNGYEIAAPLIAQLGKNFTSNYNTLITGDELLKMACDKVKDIQSLMGGKVVYLECEDKPSLRAFYERNGFVAFDKRPLDKTDRDIFKSDHLVQMLKYF